jgi:site-specific recombinase XerD
MLPIRLWVRAECSAKPLKARSVNKEIEVVTGFLRFLLEAGLVPRALARRLKYVKEPHMLPGSVLTHTQARRLLDSVSTDTADGYRNRTMLELLYSSGIRSVELLGLDLGDLDLASRTAVVLGKGRKERVVPYGATAAGFMETCIKVIRSHFLRDASETALFLDSAGRRLPYYSLRRIVHARSEAAGLEINVTPHTFRRSCTTELLRSGANMYHVKELLGHESLDTLKHYARLTITDLKRTHERCHPRDKDQA